MLRNEKILKNGDKIVKGVHLEAYLTYNPGLSTTYLTYGFDGVSEEEPLYTLLYDSQGYTYTEETIDSAGKQIFYTNTNTSLTKYFLTYGNTEALTYLYSNTNGVIGGDLKGFINHHTNLNELDINATNMSVNFDNFTWPKGMKKISFYLCPNISGEWDTMSNTDEVTRLDIARTPFSGPIHQFENLNFLSYDGWSAYDAIIDDASLWTFMPNLTYFYMRYQDNVTGNISGWTFNENFNYFRTDEMSGVEGDITNWDFSNCGDFSLFILSFSTHYKVTGSLAGWTFPDNSFGSMQLRYMGITSFGIDMSNTTCTSFNITSLPYATNDMSDLIFPDVTTSVYMYNTPLVGGDVTDIYLPPSMTTYQVQITSVYGDVFAWDIPTGITTFNFSSHDITGDVSGLTLWEGLRSYTLGNNDGITGDLNLTIPASFNGQFSFSQCSNVVLDLTSTFDFSGATNVNFQIISGVTGDFSNMILDSCTYLQLSSIGYVIPDFGDLSLNWDILSTVSIASNYTNTSDITSWFPSGTSCNIKSLYANGWDGLTGDITDWEIGTFGTSTDYSQLNLQQTKIYGDIGNWGSPLPRYVLISETDISGDIGQMDFATNKTEYAYIQDTGLSGNLSGVTLDYRIRYFYADNSTGVTGTDEFVDYIWAARKSWIATFRINISNIADTITGTYQLGDLGTYGGHEWDLTEAEINNLVLGNDYDGGGSNTPWTKNEKRYYLTNAKESEFSTTDKYKVYEFIVS